MWQETLTLVLPHCPWCGIDLGHRGRCLLSSNGAFPLPSHLIELGEPMRNKVQSCKKEKIKQRPTEEDQWVFFQGGGFILKI